MDKKESVRMGGTEVSLWLGDLTEARVDAIVNAANSSLMGGGGVDGAIHRGGGPTILEECKVIRSEIGSLPPGEAVITSAGNLPADWAIHTVGPIWRGGDADERQTLASCYRSSLTLAEQRELGSVAFPSISTGVYGYPVQEAAAVACNAVGDFLASHPDVFQSIAWVLFDADTLHAYRAAFATTFS